MTHAQELHALRTGQQQPDDPHKLLTAYALGRLLSLEMQAPQMLEPTGSLYDQQTFPLQGRWTADLGCVLACPSLLGGIICPIFICLIFDRKVQVVASQLLHHTSEFVGCRWTTG